jgi:hypothetical protein
MLAFPRDPSELVLTPRGLLFESIIHWLQSVGWLHGVWTPRSYTIDPGTLSTGSYLQILRLMIVYYINVENAFLHLASHNLSIL